MLCTAATAKPPASRARRDKYRSYGVMSDGRILAESVDLLRMAPLSCPKYASRSIDRSTAVIVSAPAGLSPVGGGYARLPPQGACGRLGVFQECAYGDPHVVQVRATLYISTYCAICGLGGLDHTVAQ